MKIREQASFFGPHSILACILCRLAVMVLVITIATLPAATFASDSTFNSYSIDFAASTRLLDALGTPLETIVQQEESCDNPHARVRARNRPGVKISNMSDAASTLSSFSLEIKEPSFLFGTGDTPLDGFNGQYIRTSPYTDEGVDIIGSSVSENGTKLTINFNGLATGKSVIFRIDLDPNDDSIFPFPDFRNVLFNAGGDEEGMLGVSSATFTSSEGSLVVTPDTPLTEIADEVLNVNYYNEGHVRPYSEIDPVIPHGGSFPTEIPEPSSAVLMLAGVIGAFVLRRSF